MRHVFGNSNFILREIVLTRETCMYYYWTKMNFKMNLPKNLTYQPMPREQWIMYNIERRTYQG